MPKSIRERDGAQDSLVGAIDYHGECPLLSLVVL